MVLLLANELAIVTSPQRSYTFFGLFSMLTHEIVYVLRHTWIGFNVILSHLPYLAKDKPEPAAMTTLVPMITNLAIRSDVSAVTLDKILRDEVRDSHDKEAALERIVETMVGM